MLSYIWSKRCHKVLFTYFLLSYIWSKRCYNFEFQTSWLQKKVSFSQSIYDVGFTTKYQRQKRRVFEVVFLCPYREKGFLILSGSLIRNTSLFSGGKFNRVVVEALSLWRESKYGVYMLQWYFKTIFHSL